MKEIQEELKNKYDEKSEELRELLEYVQIPVLHRSIMSKLEQDKLVFREQIEEHFRKKVDQDKVIHMKALNSRLFHFSIIKENESWSLSIKNNKFSPNEIIFPEEILQKAINFKTDPNKIYEIEHLEFNFHYHVVFSRPTKNLITGRVTRGETSSECITPPVIDISQFITQPQADQVEIFMHYFENNETIRRKALKHFFSQLLPEIISDPEAVRLIM